MTTRVAGPGARLWKQLQASPFAVLEAITWRGLRRPWVRRGAAAASAAASAALRPAIDWAEALLDCASPVDADHAARILSSPATVFGRCWSIAPARLAALDPRFGMEHWRLQHLQPLAARLAQAPDTALADHLLDACLAASAPPTPGCAPYPMDDGLRALSLLIVRAALRRAAPSPVRLAAAEQRIAAEVSRAADRLFSDPEYSGSLSNNHHLTAVVCLLALTDALAPSERLARRRATALHWLQRAIAVQFDADGAHFEYSSGYHFCTLELLTLAGIVAAGPGAAAQAHADADAEAQPEAQAKAPAAARQRRLRAANPALAIALANAATFAARLCRPDGTHPLIGDFDASRILRTLTVPGGDETRRLGGVEPDEVDVTTIERANGDAATALARALFALPPDDAGSTAAALPGAPPQIATPPSSALPPAALPPAARPPADRSPTNTTALSVDDLDALRRAVGAEVETIRSAVRYDCGPVAGAWLRIDRFDGAGLLILRADDALVTLRSGKPGQNGMGTHSHLDALASDVWTDRGARVADPGSWCYGASARLRNRYRSNAAHFSPLWQEDLSAALRHPFCLIGAPAAARLGHDTAAGWGVMRWRGGWVARVIRIVRGRLVIVDAASSLSLRPFDAATLPPFADGFFGPLQPSTPDGSPTSCAAW